MKLSSFLLLTFLLALPPLPSYGLELLLSWDQNTEEEPAGYYFYTGTSSRNYTETPLMLPKESLTEMDGRVGYQFSLDVSQGVTYYFAVTAYDASGYETDFSNEVQYPLPGDVTDTTPPVGSIIINGGDAVTHSLDTILTLSATDDGQELDGNGLMTLSNDGEKWSAPAPFTSGKIWTLSTGVGEKTVYAKFCDAAGNWMAEPAQDRIYYEGSKMTCDNPKKLQPVSATASRELLPLYSKNNAFDGNPLTAWSAFSFAQRDQCITLDLGEMKMLSGMNMYASKMFGADFFPTDFQIQVSRDNNTWANIGSEWGYTVPFQPPYSDRWDFDGIDCRYLKISISKAKKIFLFFHLVQIAEIEMYGCEVEDSEVPLFSGGSATVSTRQVESDRIIMGGSINTDQGKITTPGRPVVRFE